MKKNIPVTDPSITQKEIDFVLNAVRHGWRSEAQLFQDRFEKAFAAYTGTHYALATSSCTGALHLAYKALNISHGDEVIIPDITWTATAAAVTYCGATPVFADIDPQTWCLDAASVRSKINSKTKAIAPVDLYGSMPDMNALQALSQEYTIPLIEDAAEAIGSVFESKKSGSFGSFGTFSFHGTKTLTTGEGGMLVTSNQELYERTVFLNDHGRSRTDRSFWNTEIGYKYKMSAMQAALGLAQLERIDELIAKKQTIFSWYTKYLQDVDHIILNPTTPQIKNSYWMSTLVFDKKLAINRDQFQKELKEKGIDSRPFFYPLSMMPAYKKYTVDHNPEMNNPVSYDLYKRGINLPSGASLTEEQVLFICKTIKAILHKQAATTTTFIKESIQSKQL